MATTPTFTGAPRVTVDVVDASNLPTLPKNSIVCVMGITQRGEPGKPVFVATSQQYRRKLGGYHSQSLFPLYCERALLAGAKLWVVPLTHYTDITDAGSYTGTPASGTVSAAAPSTDAATFTAKWAGEGYNGVTVLVTAARSGVAGRVDITVTLPDVNETAILRDVKDTLTTAERAVINSKLPEVNVTTITGKIPLGQVTLTGAVFDLATITDTDYTGDAVAKTGWYAFDNVTDALYIANLDRPVPVVDAALADYTERRGDMRFFIRPPLGLTAEGLLDYRFGTGLYTHQPLDTWLGEMWAGDLLVANPTDVSQQLSVPVLPDALGARCRADTDSGHNYTVAGSRRGKISNALNVAYNLGSAGMIAEANAVADAGINYAINHETFRLVLWNNRSLLLDETKLLRYASVANLAMYVKRRLPAFAERELYEPNDPQTWRQVYRNTLPFITELENNRAIEPGERTGWFWYGDQDAVNATEVVYNTPEEINLGIYRVKFLFKPVNATLFIAIAATLSDSNSFQYEVVEQ